MALLYDAFGIRRFVFRANMWPGLDDITSRELRRLFAALSLGQDDEWDSFELRPGGLGARFEGEHWIYDITPNSIYLRCDAYSSPDALRATVRNLLGSTRAFFASADPQAFYVEEMFVYGVVPDDKDRHVGEVVLKRLLRTLKRDELEGNLAGLTGAGLQLVGDAEDFHWHARIEPPHGSYEVLGVAVELMFPPTTDPPTDEDDLDRIDGQVEAAHSFITQEVVTFASQLFR
jgi:hypothetical protein